MIKKILVILLTSLMMLSLASCGVRQSIDDKIAEKVTEGVVKKATGGEADLDLKKGELTVKGEDGKTVTFGESKWPEGGAAKLIPELKNGQIISVINSAEASVIMMEQVEEKDFKQYVEKLKERGFKNEATESTSQSGASYSAQSDENTMVFVMYDTENKTITISIEIKQ